jgi:flavorubredoxin
MCKANIKNGWIHMSWRNISELEKNVYWVGSWDWNRRLFDALIPLPKGTSYNSYLVVGDAGKALIDTVNPGFEKELEEKTQKIADLSQLDFVVMNHAEPDHAGAIPHILRINKKAKFVTSPQGARMAKVFYQVPEERILVVRDQETISLGNKTLKFIEAPMLHWPETMFTYLVEDKILFPCDFFGSHIAGALYDGEVEDLLVYAQRYFGEIMMPFRAMGQKALEKLSDLEIAMIAPSHGPVYRNPERILNAYRKWVNGETKQKAIVIYATMWHSTEKMIQPLVETLASEGIETALYNLSVSDIGEVAKDLVDSRAIVVGGPTVLGGVHPVVANAVYLAKALRPPLKFGLVLGSFGWGGGMVRHIKEILGQTALELVGAVEINGPPSESDISKITELTRVLARKIKEGA